MPEENQDLRKHKCFIWAQFGLSLYCLTGFFVDNVGKYIDFWHFLHRRAATAQTIFLFDSLRPVNNLSVKQERVIMGWTST